MRSVPGVASRSDIVLGQPTAHRPRRCRSAAVPTCATTDWYGSPEPGSDPAITAPYRNRPNNVQDHTPVNVYYRAVALDPGKTVAVVILPRISDGVSAGIPVAARVRHRHRLNGSKS